MRLRHCVLLGWAAAAWTLAPGGANAAAQVLALVGGDGAVPLRCEQGSCAADFSAFCLQPERRSPEAGEAYRIGRPDAVRLVGERADGSEVSLPADALLSVQALRTHVAVRLEVDESRLAAYGVRAARVEIGPAVSLLPQPSRHDAGLPAPGELREATGPLRRTGAAIVDRDLVQMGAARLTLRLLNALPRHGPAPAGAAAGLWPRAVSPVDDAAADPRARALAREGLAKCGEELATGISHSLRGCLETTHDILVGGLNNRYWAALKTGS